MQQLSRWPPTPPRRGLLVPERARRGPNAPQWFSSLSLLSAILPGMEPGPGGPDAGPGPGGPDAGPGPGGPDAGPGPGGPDAGPGPGGPDAGPQVCGGLGVALQRRIRQLTLRGPAGSETCSFVARCGVPIESDQHFTGRMSRPTTPKDVSGTERTSIWQVYGWQSCISVEHPVPVRRPRSAWLASRSSWGRPGRCRVGEISALSPRPMEEPWLRRLPRTS